MNGFEVPYFLVQLLLLRCRNGSLPFLVPSSVYFTEERNVYAPTMQYNVDEECPTSDLKIFQWRGTTTSKGTFYNHIMDERMAALLCMFSNMEEMEPYFILIFLFLIISLAFLDKDFNYLIVMQ
jgi:hypothetical protein